MTEHTLAIVIVAGLLLGLLPGSSFQSILGHRPRINWDGPHVYISLLREAAVLWLVISVLT